METPALDNPLRQGLQQERRPAPCTMVIFGASGDLTKRKLVPALYSLALQNLLPPGFSIVGAARTPMTHEAFRDAMQDAIARYSDHGAVDPALWASFSQGLYYCALDPANPETHAALPTILQQIQQERGSQPNYLFYLSTPPSLYGSIVSMLGRLGLQHASGKKEWRRIIVEKPFGHDLPSSLLLNQQLVDVFAENQIYRIDHYLGKETVQNIMVLRFANVLFEPLWNRNHIDHVQITAAESLGVEGRGGYYEQSGAFRDMLQNHMLQLLALVAMEPPVSLDAESVRDEKTKALRAIRPFLPYTVESHCVRAQYAEGSVGGVRVPGYLDEKGVNKASRTETYAATRFYIDNWRWAGVPFYLRSGKRLAKRVTEIAIVFQPVPHPLFHGKGAKKLEQNMLVLRIQPDEGVSLKFGAKLPGQALQIRPVNMEFQYGASFGKRSPEAYERLLLDAMLGDASLFARGDFVEDSWRLVMPILEVWKEAADPLPVYEAGSWGPKEADLLLEREDRRWRRP